MQNTKPTTEKYLTAEDIMEMFAYSRSSAIRMIRRAGGFQLFGRGSEWRIEPARLAAYVDECKGRLDWQNQDRVRDYQIARRRGRRAASRA